jgi:YidC/Oxa1 family membrane protein insertase
VLRSFVPGHTENYFFDAHGVQSYVDADLFGARLSNWITQPAQQLAEFGVQRPSVVLVSVPLMIIASIATHFTARHSVARQNPAAATQQTEIMAKVSLYIFPLGALVFGAILPIGLLFYWLANNAWTLMQQHFVYKRIDVEEAEQKAVAVQKRDSLAPKPGQKPAQDRKKPAAAPTQKPDETGDTTKADDDAEKATTDKVDKTDKGKTGTDGPSANGAANGTQVPGLISDRSRNKKSGRKNRR